MQKSNMENRNLLNRSQMSEMENEQISNCQSSDPRLNLGTGSFMPPSDNLAARGLNSSTYSNSSQHTNVLPLPNASSDVPSYITDYRRTVHDPYLHALSAGNSARFPPYYSQLGPCYNQVGAGGVSVTPNPQMEYGRATYKRKFPAISDVDRGTMGGCYGAGSSSNPSISTEHFHTKPVYWPRDSTSISSSYRSNNMPSVEEGSERNVRTRHGSVVHLETVQSAAPSAVSQDFHSVAGTSGLAVPAQWSHNPVSFDSHALANSSGAEISFFNHEADRSHGVGYSHNASLEIAGGHHPNFIPERTFVSLPAHNGPSTGGLIAARTSYDQRTAFRASTSYPSMATAANVEDTRLPRVEIPVPPRYLRPLSIVGCSSERNGRARTRHDRSQPYSDGGTRVRWVSEGVTMMERSNFYDSRILYDQHRDMRLDIDNMSYEELLALEERIGYVSTGLSEDAISRCLTETIYCSCDGFQDESEEEKCAICLEEYQDKDQLGGLKCRHDFHSSCIRQWLLIKNACPICKVAAAAAENTSNAK